MSHSTSQRAKMRQMDLDLGNETTQVRIRLATAGGNGGEQVAWEFQGIHSDCICVVHSLSERPTEQLAILSDGEHAPTILMLEETDYDLEVVWPEGHPQKGDKDLPFLFHADNPPCGSSLDEHVYSLRFRGYVGKGYLDVSIGGRIYGIPIEVRSKKIGYVDHYRQMLRDIADWHCTLLLELGSPLFRGYDIGGRSETCYEDFLILDHLFNGTNLFGSFMSIDSDPHVEIRRERAMHPNGIATSIDISRLPNLVSSGNLVCRDAGPIAGHLHPLYIPVTETCISRDTPENRLVKDLFLYAHDLSCRLLNDSKNRNGYISSILEGIRCRCLEALSTDWLDEVGELESIPYHSMVLLRRDDYHDILESYLLLGAGAKMRDPEIEGLLSGHNRRLSETYEQWCYLKLFDYLREMCDPHDLKSIGSRPNIEKDAWNVSALKGKGVVFPINVPLDPDGDIESDLIVNVELYYNRKTDVEDEESVFYSYSVGLQPDFTLVISIPSGHRRIVNFDAKYKAVPMDDPNSDDEADDGARGFWVRDLYKMHTYRDAMLRSFGSYILYPGHSKYPKTFVKSRHRQDGFGIPSVGAVPLIPGGETETLKGFLRRLIDTVAQTLIHDVVMDCQNRGRKDSACQLTDKGRVSDVKRNV